MEENVPKKKCLQCPIHKRKNTHPKFNKSNIETYDKKTSAMQYGI
jgi:hypothetical protein